jgi:hydroxyacylglutathione hydrolase
MWQVKGYNIVPKQILKIETCVVGELGTNCYIVSNDHGVLLIDPGAEPEKILPLVTCHLPLEAIVCTHGHYDHIGAVAYFQRKYQVPVHVHEAEKEVLEFMFTYLGVERFKVDHWLKAGERIRISNGKCQMSNYEIPRDRIKNLKFEIGHLTLSVLHTPGHSPGGICLYNEEFIITGDTLFAGGYLGRTDWPGGSDEQLQRSAQKILQLPEELKIYPGHGPASTIGREKKLHGIR